MVGDAFLFQLFELLSTMYAMNTLVQILREKGFRKEWKNARICFALFAVFYIVTIAARLCTLFGMSETVMTIVENFTRVTSLVAGIAYLSTLSFSRKKLY